MGEACLHPMPIINFGTIYCEVSFCHFSIAGWQSFYCTFGWVSRLGEKIIAIKLHKTYYQKVSLYPEVLEK